MSLSPRAVLAVLACTLCTVVAPAQKFRTEKVPECGIQFSAPERLERLPMKLGSSAVYQRARLRPKDENDYIRGQYFWYCDVYEFRKTAVKPEDIKLPPNVPAGMEEQFREMLAGVGEDRHKSFKEWLDEKEGVEILEDGDKERGRGNNLDYTHWVYTENNGFGPVGVVYCEASVYEFEDREVALVIEMPLEKLRPAKPKSKWATMIKRIMRSGEPCEIEEAKEDDERDKFADTPERKQALAEAKANIAGLQGWDYFTMPNYIVFYSWDFEKPADQRKSKKEAEYYVERLEKMRELYIEYYPLDPTGTKAIMPDPSSIPGVKGPITGAAAAASSSNKGDGESKEDQLGKKPYSVFRLCATYDQFQKYGNSSGGVVGWYSPASKELVVFLGGDKMMGQGATETVTYHEGWHQFADFYFHPPESEQHATLHRWFDEGHGDFFGSFRWKGRGWKYVGSDMRYSDCKEMVRVGDYVPWKELVNWPRQRFYTDRPAYRYAQAFSMIDFLRRGEGSRGWQEKWGTLLETYRVVTLIKGDTKKAVELMFQEFTDEDWAAVEEAWKDWVNSSKFEKG